MNKLKVVLADEDKQLIDCLDKNFKNIGYDVVATTNNGEELIELVNKFKPDLVINDIVLQGADGFKLLEKADLSKTKVIIQSSLSIDGFINKAISMGASYYCIKPFDFETLKDRIEDIMSENKSGGRVYNGKTNQIEEKITNIFITVGIPAHIKGYQFLREAIKLAIANPEIINSITKKLYPTIAEKYSTSASKVERAIRHAIEVAWDRGDVEVLSEYFGYTIQNTRGKPTNSEFIAMISDKLRLQLKIS